MKYEIDFLPVGEGSGDAIVIRCGTEDPGYYLHVVDGGRTDTADTGNRPPKAAGEVSLLSGDVEGPARYMSKMADGAIHRHRRHWQKLSPVGRGAVE